MNLYLVTFTDGSSMEILADGSYDAEDAIITQLWEGGDKRIVAGIDLIA